MKLFLHNDQGFFGKIKNKIGEQENTITCLSDVFLFLYVSAFCVLQASSGSNKYSNAIAVVLMFFTALYCFISAKNLINTYSVLFLLFVVYAFVSSLYSDLKTNTLVASNTFLRLLIMSTLLFNYLSSQNKKEYILKAFVVAGLTICTVTILYYGPKQYVDSVLSGERMGYALYAINEIAAILAVSSLISIWFGLFKEKILYYFPPFLFLFVAFGTGSRACLFIFLVGLFVLVFLKCKGKSRIRFSFIFLCVIVLFFIVLSFSTSDGIFLRLRNFMVLFTGKESADSSTLVRLDMIKWGWKSFFKSPVFGHGLESGAAVMEQYGSQFGLFHNQYIEMLSGLGLVGFCLYFSMFVYPFVKLIKPALDGNEDSVIAIVILSAIAVLFVFGSDHDQAIPVLLCYCFLEEQSLRKKL